MKNKIFFTVFFLLVFAAFASAQNKSLYSSLETAKCKTIESNPEEGGSYLGECVGFGGYKLQVAEGDIRQTINVIAPSRKIFELNFWRLNSGFSTVGPKAEWRTKKGVPIALIVRFNVANAEDSSKNTSYLMVAKISKTGACVTDIVEPGKTQNIEARKLADTASARPCKSSE